jgi:hypothetical protein
MIHKLQTICVEPELVRTLILRDPDVNLILAAGAHVPYALPQISNKRNSPVGSVTIGMLVYGFLFGLGLLMGGGFSLNVANLGVGLLSSGGIIIVLVLLVILVLFIKSKTGFKSK